MVVKIDKEISSQVLTVGLQYKNHRGGIGGVIATYEKFFEEFNFVCSYGITNNKFLIAYNFIAAIFKLVGVLLTNRNIKIVHIHGAAKGSAFRKYLLFKISKNIFGKKVIFHCHASEMADFYLNGSKFVKWLLTDFFNNVDLIIALSKSWEDFFVTNFRPKSVVVLENIVEEPMLFKRFRSVGEVSLLFLGALGNRKGIFDLLEVLSKYKDEFKGRLKLIVGGNGEVKRFEEFVSKMKLEDIVEYKGWVSGNQKVQLLQNSDIYILPSHNEGLPLSILEAMTFELPIISTYVGGIPEIVEDGVNGYLVKPGDTTTLYFKLKGVIENPENLKRLGTNSKNKVEPYYAKNVVPKLQNIYKQILNKL